MLKNITWNNIVKFWVALIIIVIFIIYKIITRDPADILLNHLENKYNKKFEIVLMEKRPRGGFYQARVYPKELEKLGKINDEYYWFDGFVTSGSASDNYDNVLLQLSANEYFLPKLEELFGKNVLPILKIDNIYSPKFTDFKKELTDIKRTKELYNIDKYFPISGGIYIFGRVENDKDREWYRKQIYEFVQFMKQIGIFEYVALGIIIIDDRVLSKEFQENEDLKAKLVENGEKYWEKDRRYYSKVIRRELMNKELSQKVTPIINLENINKSSMTNSLAWSNYNILLSFGLYSSKYVESMGWNRDSRPEVYTELKNYDILSDIKFEDE